MIDKSLVKYYSSLRRSNTINIYNIVYVCCNINIWGGRVQGVHRGETNAA